MKRQTRRERTTWGLPVLVLAGGLVLLGACQPELRGDQCSSQEACGPGERCSAEGRCIAATDERDADVTLDVPSPDTTDPADDEPEECTPDGCPTGLVCGPEGCQVGGSGDPCLESAHCGPTTPVCGPEGCQVGGSGDPCHTDDHCGVAPYCGPEETCQNGNRLDPCVSQEDCSPEYSVCNLQGWCQAGDVGDPCEEDAECRVAPFCGPDAVCQLGVRGDDCDDGTDCSSDFAICNGDGWCQAGIAEDPCSSTEECGAAFYCLDGSWCDPRHPLGATCGGHDECLSGWCSRLHCAPEHFAYIEAGRFIMGSPDGVTPDEPGGEVRPREQCRHDASTGHTFDHELLHPVVITYPFFISDHEVTQNEWATVFESTPSWFSDCDSCPVERVSWYESVMLANALSEAEGLEVCYTLSGIRGAEDFGAGCDEENGSCHGSFFITQVDPPDLRCPGYRLPTEAEWEYAARAGTETPYWGGTNEALASCADCVIPGGTLQEYAWYCSEFTSEVSLRRANPWGLYDTLGNVYEFVWDYGSMSYYPESAEEDPTGPVFGEMRVDRGGSFINEAGGQRLAMRHFAPPNYRSCLMGIRLVRGIPDVEED